MKILNVVGARPNFMKIAPIQRAFDRHPDLESKILHTGQHYDAKMSDIFFNQLEMPQPDYYLGVQGGSHAQQTARIMVEFEKILLEDSFDLVLVVGDVNSTIACALVASKLHIPIAHVEAGLRSGDRTMPEEINRVMTDSISDHLFVTEQSGMINLAKEGVPDEKVHFVGNVMIDSLVYFREKAQKADMLGQLNVEKDAYVAMTMHRPANVDNEAGLRKILKIIRNTAAHKTVVFPVHPRTSNNLKKFGLDTELQAIDNVILLEPLGYLEFINLLDNAFLVITDSGGIQEETTYLEVPCFTFRDTTERPVTITLGTNTLFADLDPVKIQASFEQLLNGTYRKGSIPPLWDGQAAQRIAEILATS